MSKLFKDKAFKYGFILGIVLFLIIQMYEYVNYLIEKEEFTHISGIHISVVWMWGFPFSVFYGGDFVFGAIIADVLIAIIFSFILGFIFTLIWSKVVTRKLT